MERKYEDLKRFNWMAKRQEEINLNRTAGFTHKDMPVTNPTIMHISEETMKKLKSLRND